MENLNTNFSRWQTFNNVIRPPQLNNGRIREEYASHLPQTQQRPSNGYKKTRRSRRKVNGTQFRNGKFLFFIFFLCIVSKRQIF